MHRTRDWRRAQRKRYVRRVAEFEKFYFYNLPDTLPSGYEESWQGVFKWRYDMAKLRADNRAPCSGPCCGNPRKWWGMKTMQERRHQITCSEFS